MLQPSERPCDQCGKAAGEFQAGRIQVPADAVDVVVCSIECMTAWFVADTERMKREDANDPATE